MITYSLKGTSVTDWDDEITRNTQMFFEADRLDAIAYQCISDSPNDENAWLRYTAAKKLADSKRTEAYQDWMRIKRAMKLEKNQ